VTTIKPEVRKTNFLLILARFRELALIGFIMLLVIVISLQSPSFLTFSNFRDILMDISILAMIALAQAMIIITRGIDLSVASMLGLTAMMVAFLIRALPSGGKAYKDGGGALTHEPRTKETAINIGIIFFTRRSLSMGEVIGFKSFELPVDIGDGSRILVVYPERRDIDESPKRD